ncbi:type IV pili methyl-accepting chemotaxis transducer N-terminal domain-containing protein [Jannaschia pohangensis]|uniref:Type IV pili methyl-accepting chemotaxis transducer N-term n=1 Tax=Jannaschia pohangensis TaxID=390807 RepID=A0A1I3V414_9RHOB|nr:type IV pili methyl-accepting chemotaxis transducer N-terminal domain-containing protein [Jannaschia pohangensis]SFJ88871.1 Type IV pili methyl-accepting chemotaxis transducer N-term [Jannaschia pohangensis]
MFSRTPKNNTEDATLAVASSGVSDAGGSSPLVGPLSYVSSRALAGLASLAALSEPAFSKSAVDNPLPILTDAQFVPDEGAASRMYYAGELRMLSQQIPTAACAYHAGIATDVSRPLLRDATAAFDRILDALILGDEELGIFGAETDRMILADVKAVHDIWDPLHRNVDAILADGPTDADVTALVDGSLPLLKLTGHMVSVVSGEYADPSILMQSDAVMLDIVGRQEMLTQEIAKDICMVKIGLKTEAARDEMRGALQTYDVTLAALIDGMPAAGVSPPPTPEIAAGLDSIAADWATLRPQLVAVLDGTIPDDAGQLHIFTTLNDLTARMAALAKLYAEDSKLGL